MSRFDPRNLLYVFLRRVHVPRWLYALGAHLLNQHFLLGAVAIIADEQGRLLLFHHTYRRRTPWGLPGGWMIRGESPLEAVVREVREESGLAIEAEELLMIGTAPTRAKLEFVIKARVVGGSFRPSGEVDAAQWYALDQLPTLPRFQRDILALWRERRPGQLIAYEAPWQIAEP